MKKALIILFMITVGPKCFSQWSIGLNTGLSEIRRDIPDVELVNMYYVGLGIDLNYSIDSSSVIFNFSPYVNLNSPVKESFTSNSNIFSTFRTPVFIMVGSGIKSHLSDFIEVRTSLQLGYLYTISNHNYYNINAADESLERKFSQFALGPKINIGFGKNNIKGRLIFENYFFSNSPNIIFNTFGRERLTRLSVGLSFKLGNKK